MAPIILYRFFDASSQMATVAAGYRSGAGAPSNVGTNGNYWSATSSSATNAYNVNFNTTNFNSANSNNRYNGNSVRLASVVSALALNEQPVCTSLLRTSSWQICTRPSTMPASIKAISSM